MPTVASRDGTSITYDQVGTGPALILVAGALCSRLSWSGPALADHLAAHRTVINYDRRGRGASGETPPYALEREVEDIAAVLDAVGGTASLYGHSSGGALALTTASRLGARVDALALYEVPYNDDPSRAEARHAYSTKLAALLAADRRGDAVALFMRNVGMLATQVEDLRQAPFWAGLAALAATLAYDQALVMAAGGGVPRDQAARVAVPTLVMNGGAGAPFMAATARTLSELLPQGQLRVLDGQTHDVQPEALAPVLRDFFVGAVH